MESLRRRDRRGGHTHRGDSFPGKCPLILSWFKHLLHLGNWVNSNLNTSLRLKKLCYFILSSAEQLVPFEVICLRVARGLMWGDNLWLALRYWSTNEPFTVSENRVQRSQKLLVLVFYWKVAGYVSGVTS